MSSYSPSISSLSPDTNIIGDGLTTINILTLKGTALAGTQLSIFDGSTLLGAVLTDAYGFWTFTTGALADRTYGLIATDADGGSSQLVGITVVPNITSFSSANDSQIKVDGKQYIVQNADKSWSLSSPDAHTLRFEITGGDKWDLDPSGNERSEIAGKEIHSPGEEINVSYGFMVEPGPANTASGPGKWGKWLILSQFHANDLVTSPPFAIEMIGEKLAVVIRYQLPGQDPTDAVYVYKGTSDIERGKYYGIKIEANFSADESGYVKVWLDGTQIVDYQGPLGYDNGVYWKQGVYRSSASESIAVNYKNLYVDTHDAEMPVAPGDGETIVGTDTPDIVDADDAPEGQPLPTAEGDLIVGKAGKDKLYGLEGDDQIFGNSGRDKLFGRDGDDMLSGGRGGDQLSGGTGADRFVFGSIKESKNGGDMLLDFTQVDGDLVDLSGVDADRTTAGNQAFQFIGGTAFTGAAGELRFVNGKLSGDVDGDGKGDFIIKVAGSPSLTPADLVL